MYECIHWTLSRPVYFALPCHHASVKHSGGEGGAIHVQNIQQKCVGQAPHVPRPVLRSGQQLKQIIVNIFLTYKLSVLILSKIFFEMLTNLHVKLYHNLKTMIQSLIRKRLETGIKSSFLMSFLNKIPQIVIFEIFLSFWHLYQDTKIKV